MVGNYKNQKKSEIKRLQNENCVENCLYNLQNNLFKKQIGSRLRIQRLKLSA